MLIAARTAEGQAVDWVLVLDGRPEPWPASAVVPADSAGASRIALQALRARGLFNAGVDSVVMHAGRGAAYARSGPVPVVGTVRVAGLDDPTVGRSVVDELVGHPLETERLRQATTRLLEALERRGRPESAVRITGLLPDSTGERLVIRFAVEPGVPVLLEGVLVQGAVRTSPSLVERITGLSVGTRIRSFDPDAIAGSLEETGLFSSVEPPVLLVTGDSTAIVQIVLRDAAPGSFDAALGYQPGTGGSSGQFVGTGRLALVNPFGGGRRFDVLIDRLPGQVSRAELSASDPFFLGWPVGLEGSFAGLQQDSTFGRQRVRLEAAVRLTRSVALTASATRETARPGTAGARIEGSRQIIPRSEGTFAGIGVRYRTLDRGQNPRRGLLLDVRFERGSFTRRASEVDAKRDTVRVSTRHRAERLTTTGRAFVPVGRAWVIVAGGDASVLVSPVYERSDLFRLGGARSLRGYDEDRFEGRVVGRGLAEVRRLIDLRSYVFLFTDIGFLDVPDGLAAPAGFEVKPGFGFGLQVDTAAGLVTATYGFNPDDGPTNGRIHVAFSFGL